MSTLEELIASECWSQWDGHSCCQAKGHEGLHLCHPSDCGAEWTTEQATLWLLKKVYTSYQE